MHQGTYIATFSNGDKGGEFGEFRFAVNLENKRTVAVVNIGERVGVGVARCNPNDHYNEELGIRIACARAVKSVIQEVENHWVGLTKTKEEVIAQRASKRKI